LKRAGKPSILNVGYKNKRGFVRICSITCISKIPYGLNSSSFFFSSREKDIGDKITKLKLLSRLHNLSYKVSQTPWGLSFHGNW